MILLFCDQGGLRGESVPDPILDEKKAPYAAREFRRLGFVVYSVDDAISDLVDIATNNGARLL